MAGRYANSPGPKYRALTATGYEGHDPTLPRAPAYSIATARRSVTKTTGPGAKYNTAGLSHRGGPFRSREAYLEGRRSESYPRGPSALSYGAHLCPDTAHVRPPAWWLLGRNDRVPRSQGPAPKYRLHDLIGTQAPGFSTAPQCSLLGRSGSYLGKTCSPGPGRYGSVPNEVVHGRAPTPQVLSNHASQKRGQIIPAPKYLYTFNEKLEPPSYSFGVRYSPRTGIVYTHEDLQPFYGF